MRLISAHCSTPTTRLLLAQDHARARVRTRPDAPDPAPGGSLFDRRRWVSIQAAPTRAWLNRVFAASMALRLRHPAFQRRKEARLPGDVPTRRRPPREAA